MGSTRLPGKVLKPDRRPAAALAHRSSPESVAPDRRHRHRHHHQSAGRRDRGIRRTRNGITVVRGPEDDVLARFARAAEQLDADIIVRVSSDAPFLDAGFIDHLIASMIEQDGDYVLMEEGAPCAHEGVDPFTRRALDKLMMDARDDPVGARACHRLFQAASRFRADRARAAPIPRWRAKAAASPSTRPTISPSSKRCMRGWTRKAGEASLADLLLLLEREPRTARHQRAM